MARVAYARVSSKTQKLDRQIEKLKNKNIDKLFKDIESGAKRERPGLNALLKYIRSNDIVIVTELDRLGRNSHDLTEIMSKINSKGATLEVLNLPSMSGIEDENLRQLINNLVIELYKYQAELERNKIKERQAQGIKIAKKQGRFRGKPPLFSSADDPRLKYAFNLYREGKTLKQVQDYTGINRETFRRYLKKYNIKR
ncbi:MULTISPECIES: recombinase family protein [Aerococcus]|uniref:Recombinase family protein n=1 Tax=Aerococcus tenax TaxID=3078812 RepID=A0A5N1BI27_9LACT|nr:MULTISPECIES: recombinase family protein [Aerococcus]KAA9237839.1 recombinase family protein [Aerococcus urinae]MDK6371641.1 recombinase family protein [Aerococcus urinae]MDK6597066.1 recombinase family protein [Aerococcus urinae]MDK7802022.1 recombinase family protein [Aerococcus urinae]MDK8655609.1 recombinase family protein [Aerococcus urinae]